MLKLWCCVNLNKGLYPFSFIMTAFHSIRKVSVAHTCWMIVCRFCADFWSSVRPADCQYHGSGCSSDSWKPYIFRPLVEVWCSISIWCLLKRQHFFEPGMIVFLFWILVIHDVLLSLRDAHCTKAGWFVMGLMAEI